MIAENSASSSSYDVRISAAIVRVARPDLAADVDAGAVGQPAVEDRDVGAQRRDAPDRLLRRAGLAHDLDVAVGLEQVAQPAADDLVVVEQEHPDLLGAGGRLAGLHGSGLPDRRRCGRHARPRCGGR